MGALAELLVKLLLAPAFVVGASVVARRHGPSLGGLLGGLPVVAGPILLAYALAHGPRFAAGAAAGTLLGLVSLIGFVLAYGRLATAHAWVPSTLLGWLLFALLTAAFASVTISDVGALALSALALTAALRLLPRAQPDRDAFPPPPPWDLPLRAGCACVLVLTLTAVSGWLGPHLSGLLAPFPIIATVLAAFTHAQQGAQETLRVLRGLLTGFAGFALFCFTLVIALPRAGTGAAFALATAIALITQGFALIALRHRRPEQTRLTRLTQPT